MLYKFKSRATADLTMLEANGRQVLQIIGKSLDDEHGIITAEQIPAAIAALEAAATQDQMQRKQSDAQNDDDGDEQAGGASEAVSLSQRVAPLIDMLRRSAAEGKEVTW